MLSNHLLLHKELYMETIYMGYFIYIYTFICGIYPKMYNLVKDCLLLCSCL
jgi:hypothetical protein